MKILVFISVFILLSSCATKKNIHSIPYSSSSNSLLWEINGKDLKEPSYLFGTIHLISADDFYISEATKNALKPTKLLVTEVDIKSLYSVNPAKLMLPKDSTLKDYMTEDDYNKVRDIYITKMHMTGDAFDNTLAKMLPVMLQQQITLLAFGDNTKSYEMEFIKLANKQKTENVGLETQEFQVNLLTKTPVKEQVKILIESVDSVDRDIRELKHLIKLYKEERLEDIAAYMNSGSNSEFSNQKDEFLVNRNKDWIPKIEALIKEKSCFIAVGAAHLPSEIGVIELLKAKGYSVKPLKN